MSAKFMFSKVFLQILNAFVASKLRHTSGQLRVRSDRGPWQGNCGTQATNFGSEVIGSVAKETAAVLFF